MAEKGPNEPVKTNPYDIERMNKEIVNGSRYKQEERPLFDPYDLSKNIIEKQGTRLIKVGSDSEE